MASLLSQTVLSDTPEEDYKNGLAALKSTNPAAGRALLRKAADAGHHEAQYELGLDFLLRGSVTQAGIYFQMAADAGHAPSQTELGLLNLMSDEDAQARKYFELAAAQGYAEGEYRLGTMFVTGQTGDKSLKRAFELFVRAAEKGHPQAVENVAAAYLFGRYGLGKEDMESPEALKWIRKASESDYIPAVERMVEVHRQGLYGQAASPERAKELHARLVKLRGEDEVKKKGRRSK